MNNNYGIDLSPIISGGNVVTSKKMNIKGQVQNMDVYKIPLNMLYYNDQNDRIATEISKYEAEYGDISNLSKEDYNKQIESYIIKSDKQRFKDTMNNIKNFSQLEPGVVFLDGRVIDGNRRFTCLRKLFEETGDQRFNYFEAVILDNNITPKEIKLMELVLQHGQEGKLDYNPIQKLVGIYRDIIENNLFTIKEYATSVDLKESEVEKSVELAVLMADFLEYINAPKQFYIARDLEIDGPLNEIYLIKKRIGSDEEKWSRARVALYDNLLMKTKNDESGDITRIIREFGKRVVNNDEIFNKYCEKQEALSIKLNEKLVSSPVVVTTEFIKNEIRSDKNLQQNISKNLEEALYEAKKQDAKNAPVEAIMLLNRDTDKIDLSSVSRLSGEAREEFYKQLVILKDKVNKIEEKFNEFI